MEELGTTTKDNRQFQRSMTHLINQKLFRVVSAGEDIGPMYSLTQKAGWNQTLGDLKILAAQHPQGNLLGVADISGVSDPLGSGMVLNVGESLAWIGMILVHPAHRRQGIASAIMEECIEVARLAMGNSIVGLDATPAGLQVYKNIGFQRSFKIWRCQLKTDTAIPVDASVEVVRDYSMYKYTKLLKITGLHQKFRGLRLIHKMHSEGTLMAMSKGKPVGMVMTRPGRLMPFIGPLVATSSGVAKTLLDHVLKYWKERGHDEVFMDIPEKHFKSASRWENETKCIESPTNCILTSEIRPLRSLIRMYEVITDDNFSRLSTRISQGKRPVRSLETLKHGRAGLQATTIYMKQEIETLQYIYAAGGPELS